MEELDILMKRYTGECVKKLSKKYKFDNLEASRYLKLSEVKKGKIVLPFCGKINEECCEGIKLNYDLYTQCHNKKESKNLCKSCIKDDAKYGRIQERVKDGDNFRDPKGKKPVKYGNVMEKLNITKEEAIAEAEKYGLIIPESEFEIYKAKRGRPKKNSGSVRYRKRSKYKRSE